VKNALLFLTQLFLIWFIYQVSDYVVDLLRLPIPSSVFGMISLYLLLSTGVVKHWYIERAALFLNKHLAFFFIPFSVGLMNYSGLIKSSGLRLIVMICTSTIIGLLITSGLTQFLTRKEKAKHERSHSHSF
jgi:holin-like protein